jgi:N-dimethylarginine dimethylaminohydrolase
MATVVPTVSRAVEHFPQGYGLDNQTGVLTDVLLGSPANLDWLPINSIARMALRNREKLGTTWSKERALAQWQAMVDVYTGAGVRVHLVEADAGLTHSVYTRDSTFMTPWGPVVAAIQTEARRRDYAVIARTYERLGVPIWNWVTAGYFEGGDFGIIEPGKALLGYAGDRSTAEGANQVKGWLEAEGWEAMTVPLAPQFVHLDAVVVMLAEKLALVCEDALERYALDWFDANGIRRIPVTYRECVGLGGNLVSLGGGRVLSMAANTTVNARLRAEGLEVHAVEYDQMALCGGGVHCSCHELRRDPG